MTQLRTQEAGLESFGVASLEGLHRSCLKGAAGGGGEVWETNGCGLNLFSAVIPAIHIHLSVHSTSMLNSAWEINVPKPLNDASWAFDLVGQTSMAANMCHRTAGTNRCPYRRAAKMPGRVRREKNLTAWARLGKWKTGDTMNKISLAISVLTLEGCPWLLSGVYRKEKENQLSHLWHSLCPCVLYLVPFIC